MECVSVEGVCVSHLELCHVVAKHVCSHVQASLACLLLLHWEHTLLRLAYGQWGSVCVRVSMVQAQRARGEER